MITNLFYIVLLIQPFACKNPINDDDDDDDEDGIVLQWWYDEVALM